MTRASRRWFWTRPLTWVFVIAIAIGIAGIALEGWNLYRVYEQEQEEQEEQEE